MSIPVFRPSIKRSDMTAVLNCLVSEKIGPGSEAERFTRLLLRKMAYATGTLLRDRLRGIELALRCLNVPAGSRIAISPLSDRVYHHALTNLSLEPVYIDSMENIPAMDIAALERVCRKNPVQGIILDHHLGFSPDMKLLLEQNIPLIQDISRIISPDSHDAYKGNICLLSLEAEDVVTAGGGIFLAFAQKKPFYNSILKSYPDDIFLPDMNAALGAIQINELERFLDRRREILAALRQIPVSHRMLSNEDQPCPSLLPLLLNSPMQEVIQHGMKLEVEIRPAFARSIIQDMLKDFDADGQSPAEHYPESTKFALRTVLLPLHPGLRTRDVETLQKLIKTLPVQNSTGLSK